MRAYIPSDWIAAGDDVYRRRNLESSRNPAPTTVRHYRLDGTKKHFFKNGNERTCDWIEDRHLNRTNLTYGLQVQVSGVTKNPLTQVTDPSGRALLFTWQNLGTVMNPAYRITQVDSPLYVVTYEYNIDLNLWKVRLDAAGLDRSAAPQ